MILFKIISKKRIRNWPKQNIAPPVSNILMNLKVPQLREILLEIINWDATGRDIFDTDYLFTDPIKERMLNNYLYIDFLMKVLFQFTFISSENWTIFG